MEFDTLLAISPVDGRYRKITEKLNMYFSEFAYIKYRVIVELKWLKYLLESKGIIGKDIEIIDIDKYINSFDLNEAKKVKEYERITNHDVKAIEYYVRELFKGTSLEEYESFVHFGCTSEDVNNLAHSLMINEANKSVLFPMIENLLKILKEKSFENKSVSMLSHTHGQPATPTTFGKELAVFIYRIESLYKKMIKIDLKGKFSGAVGNYNAHVVAYPQVDWIDFTKKFVEELKIEYNPLSTQIENHDTICEIFSYMKLINNVIMDFNSDMWMYISNKYLKLKVIASETGSSVMPHKVNPINFENSMANIRMANCIIDNFTNNLQVSRMQRDLSDSSNLRNMGVTYSHMLISLENTIIGINKIDIDKEILNKDLNNNPEVLSEAIQTVLRKNRHKDAYEQLKNLTRGKRITLEQTREYIKELDITEEDKINLLKLTPENYIGVAEKLIEFNDK